MSRKEEYIIVDEVNLSNGNFILIWNDGVITLPSDELTLEEAVNMIGALQKAIEKSRDYQNSKIKVCARCNGTNRVWDNGDMISCHE